MTNSTKTKSHSNCYSTYLTHRLYCYC